MEYKIHYNSLTVCRVNTSANAAKLILESGIGKSISLAEVFIGQLSGEGFGLAIIVPKCVERSRNEMRM
jgi:hypothetical protein